METSRRRLGRRQDSQESRDSSVSSSSREVRCGCQYFQSDSLLPERHSLVGTRPSSRTMNIGEHEYEPISPMVSQSAPPPVVRVTDMEGAVKGPASDASSNDSHDQHFLRIPLDDELIVRGEDEDNMDEDGDDRAETRPTTADGDDIERDANALREERFFAATPTTTASRTDCEINTSQVDSSGLDELPLKKDARRANEVRGIQQRIRSQAGRIRSKLRNISRPKINLPEKPKINLPERPKFNFPERPKFNFPQRPKISMPSFSFGKNKNSSIRRPLRDRNQAQSVQSNAGSKKNIFDSFRTYPRIFSKKKRAALNETQGKGKRAQTPPPRMETEESTPSTPASRKGLFGQRWTQRYKDIKFADDENQSVNQSDKQKSFDDDVEDDSAPFHDSDFGGAVTLEEQRPKRLKAASSGSIPESDKEQQSSGTSSERHRVGVLEEIDSDEFFLREKGLSREDVDVSRYLSLEIRDAFRKPKNALARLDTELYDDDLDYDFDQPTVRMPGEPIRRSMEAMRRESLEPIRMTPEPEDVFESQHEPKPEQELEPEPVPVRPDRTRSLRIRPRRSKSEEAKRDSNFNTFPPSRPTRGRKKSEQGDKQSIGTSDINIDIDNEDNRLDTKQSSIPSVAITDSTKDMTPSRFIDESSEALHHHWHQDHQPPLPPKRKRSTKDLSQDNESVSNGHYANDKWIGVDAQIMVPGEVTALSMEIENDVALRNGYYDSPPIPPLRKHCSRGTSLADEDRTSRGADSLISETRDPDEPYEEEMLPEPEPQINVRDNCDYAVVEKTVIEKTVTQTAPQRPNRPRPPRPPPPGRKERAAQHITNLKNQSINFFFTYPRRAIKSFQREPPIRPLRNYSTVGHNNRERPSRPPRKNRVFREPVYAEGEIIPLKDENEQDKNEEEKIINSEDKIENVETEVTEDLKDSIIDHDDTIESRDLQSGDIIEKMKGRPLPPPPRPPRKSKDDITHHSELSEETNKQITDLDEDISVEEDIVIERIDIQIVPQNASEPPKEEYVLSPDKIVYSNTISDTRHLIGEEKTLESTLVDEPPVKTLRKRKSLSSTITDPLLRETQQPTEAEPKPDEVTISTQTDPLPEGLFVEEEPETIAKDIIQTETSTEIKPPPQTPSTTQGKIVKLHTVIEKKVVVSPDPDTEIECLKTRKLQVSELDVEKLNVAELQAQKITVSDIDGVTMQVSELTSKGGNLVVSGIEIPPSLLQSLTPQQPPAPPTLIIRECVQQSTQTTPPPITVNSQTNTSPDVVHEKIEFVSPTPATVNSQKNITPEIVRETIQFVQQPPSIVVQSQDGQSAPVFVPDHIPTTPQISKLQSPQRTRAHISPPQSISGSEDELRLVPRQKRHHSHKHSRYSSDEEEDYDNASSSHAVSRRHHQRDPSATQLIRQLIGIWQNNFTYGVNRVIDGLNAAFPEGEKRKDAQTAACIVLVLILLLMIVGIGSDRTVHHHHWDFIPPHP